ALSGFGIGGLLLLIWWPRVPRGSTRPWLAALASRDLWHRALGIAAVQGLVSLFAAIDVVFVAALPESRALAASYQVSAALSRAPLFVAGAVSTAFFPVLTRSAGGGALAARAVRMYAVVALPLATILATTPGPVLTAVFPAQYGAMATLLKFTAVAGLAVGGINMLATFFQAVSDYSCAWWLLAGLAGYVVALLSGWVAGGITGLAVGSVLGATAALGLLGYRCGRRLGHGLLARFPLAGPVLTALVLVVLRRYPVPWLLAATGGLFARNLAQVTGRLGEADIPAVLVKGDLPDDCVRNDFDLVVEERHWDGTFTALAGWYVHSSTFWLQRTTKALLFPPVE